MRKSQKFYVAPQSFCCQACTYRNVGNQTFYRSNNNYISAFKQLLLSKSVIRLHTVAGDIKAQVSNWIRVLKHLTHCSYINYLAWRYIKRSRAKKHCKRTGNGFCTAKLVSPLCQHFSKSNDALHNRRCLVPPSDGLADTPRGNTQR